MYPSTALSGETDAWFRNPFTTERTASGEHVSPTADEVGDADVSASAGVDVCAVPPLQAASSAVAITGAIRSRRGNTARGCHVEEKDVPICDGAAGGCPANL